MGSETSLTGSGAIRVSLGSTRESEIENNIQALQKASLYVFGEKSQMKNIKIDPHIKVDFIPVDYPGKKWKLFFKIIKLFILCSSCFPEARRLRASFKKLMQACNPSSVAQGSNAAEKTFHKLVEQSEWLVLLQAVMQLAGAVTDLMDIQCSSVMLCLEDGWDLTCQVSSLAQLCLDPYYRTIAGFRTLVEKEWVNYGHRFNHRSNLDNASQDNGFTPVFLQFLDIVHQLLNQFPMAFEFSHFYLKFLAYHHVSCRFRTFLLDTELQRTELGLVSSARERNNSLGNGRHEAASSDEESGGPGTVPTVAGSHLGISVFDYIERAGHKSPVFNNSLFCPELQQAVLRPFSHISDLSLWDYYIKEELRSGPAYDLELAGLDLLEEESDVMVEPGQTRQSLTQGYDNM